MQPPLNSTDIFLIIIEISIAGFFWFIGYITGYALGFNDSKNEKAKKW